MNVSNIKFHIILACIFLSAFSSFSQGSDRTIQVGNAEDSNDGHCSTASSCNLRAALQEASNSLHSFTIQLDSSMVHTITLGTIDIGNTSCQITSDSPPNLAEIISGEENAEESLFQISKYTNLSVFHISISGFVADYGGVFYIPETTLMVQLQISNSIFFNNSAVQGGVLYVQYWEHVDGHSILINSSTFQNNSAEEYGGALYLEGRNTFFESMNCSYLNNVAEEGGAIYAATWSVNTGMLTFSMTMTWDTYKQNVAGTGGAFSTFSTAGAEFLPMHFQHCQFFDNDADFGPAMQTKGIGLEVEDTSFQESDGQIGGIAYLTSSTVAHFTRCHFERNRGYYTGGITFIDSSLYINSSSFDSNKCTKGLGGAVTSISQNDLLQIANTTLFNNSGFLGGGAVSIYALDDYFSVTESFFSSNTGGAFGGGALYIHSSSGKIESCQFENNTSTYHGGAVGTYSDVDIKNTEFQHCATETKGGALFVGSSVVSNITDSTFFANSGSVGGAVYASSSSISFIGTTKFKYNSAKVGGALVGFEANVRFAQCEYKMNEATLFGGALFGEAADFHASDLLVLNNLAEAGGGAFLNGETKLSGSNVTLHRNLAALGNGGGLYALLSSVTLTASNAKRNEAPQGNGGAFYLQSSSSLAGYQMEISDNSASNGGGIYCVFQSETLMQNSDFSRNVAQVYGGTLYMKDSSLSTYNTTIYHSSAQMGGSTFAVRTQILSSNTEWINNTAQGDGGAAYLSWNMESSRSASFDSCNFKNNSAGSNGGGIAALSDVFDDTDGATDFVLTRCSFWKNSAGTDGGGLYLESVDATIHATDFTSNLASNGGASVLVAGISEPSFIMTDSKFDSNIASNIAGAIQITGYSSNVSETSFTKNMAFDVPACSFSSASFVSLSSSNFTKNVNYTDTSNTDQDLRGSLAFESVAKAKLSQVDFHYNGGAQFRGGAIQIQDSDIEIYGGLFSDNKGDYGGAIDVSSTSSTVNSSAPCGQSLSVQGVKFIRNSANVGGAIFWDDESEPCFSGVSFSDNSGKLYGDDLASTAKQLVSGLTEVVTESGEELDEVIEICFADFYSSTVVTQPTSTVMALSKADGTTLSGTTIGIVVGETGGCTNFTELTVTADPGSSLPLTFINSEVGSVKIETAVEACELGNVLPQGGQVCFECAAGEYTWSNNGTTCTTCPRGAVCFGGTHMKAEKGYWRFNKDSTGACANDDLNDCSLFQCSPAYACGGVASLSSTAEIRQNTRVLKVDSDVSNKISEGDTLVVSGQYLTISTVNTSGTLIYVHETFTGESETAATIYIDQPEECHANYQGNACSKCVTGYAKSFGSKCEVCPESYGVTVVIVVLGILAICLIALGLVYLQVHASQDSVVNIYGKIVLSYCQMLSLLSAFEIPWPSAVEKLFEGLDLISFFGDKLVSVNCLLNTFSWEGSMPQFYVKFMSFMGIPILSIALPAIFWHLAHLYHKSLILKEEWAFSREDFHKIYEKSDRMEEAALSELLKSEGHHLDAVHMQHMVRYINVKGNHAVPTTATFKDAFLHQKARNHFDLFISSTIVFLFLCHPNITKMVFLAFTCQELDTDTWYLHEDLDFQCFTSTFWAYTGAMVLPFFLMFVFGIPLLGLYFLFKVRKDLNEKHVFQKFGFLYKGFQRQYYCWEIWIIFRKIILIFISVFVVLAGEMVTALTGFLVTSFFLVVQLQFKPYVNDKLNGCESFGLACVVLSYFCGLFFIDDETNDTSFLYTGFAVLTYIINTVFLLYILSAMIQELIYNEIPRLRKSRLDRINRKKAARSRRNSRDDLGNKSTSQGLTPEMNIMDGEESTDQGPMILGAPDESLIGLELANSSLDESEFLGVLNEDSKVNEDVKMIY